MRYSPGFERGFKPSVTSIEMRWPGRSSTACDVGFFLLLIVFAAAVSAAGRDFFPQVDAGQMRLHVRAPAGTRIEETQAYLPRSKPHPPDRRQRPDRRVLDNIGLPYSGINIALSDSATVGPMDGEILISLKEKHTPTAAHVADLRRELPQRFPELQFFFQPADIVNQVLNFGQPAPIDIRVSGPDSERPMPWPASSPTI